MPRNALLIKLDGLGDWVLCSQYVRQLQESQIFKNCKFDILGDVGFKDFFGCTEKNFNEQFWISKRGNLLLKLGTSVKNAKLKRIIEKAYLAYLSIKLKGLYKKKYDVVIVSCWNNALQQFINQIVKNINSKTKIARAIYQNRSLEESHNKVYTKLIPVSGDHLKFFRGDLERIFFENIANEKFKLEEKEITPRKINKAFIFCGAFHKKRRLDPVKYMELAEAIFKTLGIKSVIYGVPEDFKESSMKNHRHGIVLNKGISDINDIIHDIKNSDIYIGNDTGFLHYALSLGKPAIVISNGNSFNTFLKYPSKPHLHYIFTKEAEKIIQSEDEQEVERITKSSDFDINTIDSEIMISTVVKFIKNYENSSNRDI